MLCWEGAINDLNFGMERRSLLTWVLSGKLFLPTLQCFEGLPCGTLSDIPPGCGSRGQRCPPPRHGASYYFNASSQTDRTRRSCVLGSWASPVFLLRSPGSPVASLNAHLLAGPNPAGCLWLLWSLHLEFSGEISLLTFQMTSISTCMLNTKAMGSPFKDVLHWYITHFQAPR